MEPTLPAIEGLRIRGTGHARPSDLAPGAVPGRLTNADVYERLLGPDWRAELERRGLNWAQPRNAWGITAREWACEPGGAPIPGCGVVELAAAAGRRALEVAGWGIDDVTLVRLATNRIEPEAVSGPQALERAILGDCEPARALAAEFGAALATRPDRHDVRVLSGAGGGLWSWVAALAALAANHGAAAGSGAARHEPAARRLLLVGADILSAAIDPEDLGSALVHGDAAAAVAIELSDEPGGGLAGAGLGALAAEASGGTAPAGDFLRAWLRRRDAELTPRAEAAWERAVDGIVNLPSAAVFMPFGVTRRQVERVAGRAHYSPARTKASITEHGCTGAAAIFLSLHDFLHDSERAGADLNVVNVDLVGAGPAGYWAWMRWNLGDGTEPEAAHVPT